MMRTASLTLVAIATLWGTAARAESWRLASSGVDTAYFIDVDTVKRVGNVVTFTSMTIYDGTTDKRDFDSSVVKRDGRCSTYSARIVAGDYYSGRKLLIHDTTQFEMKTFGPNSVMNGVMRTVCGDRAYASPILSDPWARARELFAEE